MDAPGGKPLLSDKHYSVIGPLLLALVTYRLPDRTDGQDDPSPPLSGLGD